MSNNNNDASQEDKDKIKTAIEKGNLVFPQSSEGVFPLNFNDHKKGDPYEFTYIAVSHAWGKKEYAKRPEWNNWGGFVVSWGAKGVGFGELTFVLKGGKFNEETRELEGATLECDSEAMGRQFIKEALMALAEKVVIK